MRKEGRYASRTTSSSELPKPVLSSWPSRHPVRRAGPVSLAGDDAACAGVPVWGLCPRRRDRGSGAGLLQQRAGVALVLVEGLLGITAFALLFLVAAWAIVTGIMQVVGAMTLLPGTGHTWLLVLSGLASVVFGIVIALWPGAGTLTVIWLIGIYAIVFGVVYIAAYFQSRALTREPDLIGMEAGVVSGWSSHSLEQTTSRRRDTHPGPARGERPADGRSGLVPPSYCCCAPRHLQDKQIRGMSVLFSQDAMG
jgi:Short repeat of unknown function (DUF308)